MIISSELILYRRLCTQQQQPQLESQYTQPTLYLQPRKILCAGLSLLLFIFLPWESLLWFPVEESPGPNSQADQLKAEGDQHPVTANSTLQLGVPKQQHY